MPRGRMASSKRTSVVVIVIVVLVGFITSTHASSSKNNDFDFLDSTNGGRWRLLQDGTAAPTEYFSTTSKDNDNDGKTTKTSKNDEPTRSPVKSPTTNSQSIFDKTDPSEPGTQGQGSVNGIVAGIGATSAAVMVMAAVKQRKKQPLSRKPGGSKGHGGSNRSSSKGLAAWTIGGKRSPMSSMASSIATRSVSDGNSVGGSRQLSSATRSSRIDMLRRGAANAGKAANKSFGDLQTRSNNRGKKRPRPNDPAASERQALESLTEWEGHMFSQGGPPRMTKGGKREPRGARHKDGVNAFWQYASAGLPSAGRSPPSRGSSNYLWRSPTGGTAEQHSKGYLQSANTEKTWGSPSVGGDGTNSAQAELPKHQQGLAALLVVAARLRDDFKGQQEANEIMVAEQGVDCETTASNFLKELYRICGKKTVGQAVAYARNRTSFRGAMMRARQKVVGLEEGGNRDSNDYML